MYSLRNLPPSTQGDKEVTVGGSEFGTRMVVFVCERMDQGGTSYLR